MQKAASVAELIYFASHVEFLESAVKMFTLFTALNLTLPVQRTLLSV